MAPAAPFRSISGRRAAHTSCRSVVYIGDSTSEGETSPSYIPNAGQRLGSQLAQVGAYTFYPEISGARSIVETYHGFANGTTSPGATSATASMGAGSWPWGPTMSPT